MLAVSWLTLVGFRHALSIGASSLYLAAMLGLAGWLGRRQRSGGDYFLAGRGMASGSCSRIDPGHSVLNEQFARRTCFRRLYGWRWYGLVAI